MQYNLTENRYLYAYNTAQIIYGRADNGKG